MSLGHLQARNLHIDSVIISINNSQLKYLNLVSVDIYISRQLLTQLRLKINAYHKNINLNLA